jgi:hypothetical protein
MKRVLFVLILCCATLKGHSQHNLGRVTGYSFYDLPETKNSALAPQENIAAQNISTVTTTRKYNGGSSTEIKSYDKTGRTTTREYSNSDGGYSKETYTYHADGKSWESIRVNGKGETTASTIAKYNTDGRLVYQNKTGNRWERSTGYFQYDQNGNQIYTYTTNRKGKFSLRKKVYDPSTNKILVSELYGKDTSQLIKRLEYSYYEDGSKKAIFYYEKDKLVYTWSFDCKPEGELVNVEKTDSSVVCLQEELDENGNAVTWYHEFNSEGVPVKTKSVKGPDGKLIEVVNYQPDGRVWGHAVYFPNGDRIQFYANKKGQLYVDSESRYNEKGQLIYDCRGTGKWMHRNWYFYDSDKVIRKVSMWGKNSSEETYSYTYHN